MDRVIRGDIVTVVTSGDYGRPRPALVMQSDAFTALPSVTVLPLTSTLLDLPAIRVAVMPGTNTGLRVPSQIMIDKILTIPRVKIGRGIGSVDAATLTAVTEALRAFLVLE